MKGVDIFMKQININYTNNLISQNKNSILFTTNRPNIVMEHGKGMYLLDTEGKCYLDFIGGWAVNCLGHCPDIINDAIIKQAKTLINASPSFYNKPMLQFAKLLTDNSCFDRVFFSNSGSEANEGAIKLARKYGEKFLDGAYEIITMINSFHGRTLATMSATGKKVWENLYEPKVPGFKHVPLNDIDALKASITSKTCAIMLEPIQGEGGVNKADKVYIETISNICKEHGILLIFDEVQTGIGRTGKLFAYEHYGIEPDIMTLAKGIGGGYPLSALLTKEKLNIFEPGDQGGTYSAQPLGMAVGMAVVEEVINKKLFINAEIQGNYILKKLRELKDKYKLKNIRGNGLLIAFDLPCDKGTEIVDKCLHEGLILNSPRPSIIRLMPPLIVTEKDTDNMINILTKVLDLTL
ncbi:acetylornithine aminotransferase [Clostridium pasteurianum DSM 525 = ATCC 6013]|uniref:Acetylornithine aminotransferase n=2 Tax=Clostridium pasteurianum TaxID=1501 RepID=A0A0H3J3V5_CLOPA|nr:acetylornithine/succinylornithine family transaminase [Clostridium pasteurianum]AJA46598.1 acetylornithine aminotransferase [Clostridium pasteurianum DSM 525 = ATCC 6013]AJA50586.1 acetylornithine aminotransferase [Clostridium pasteurianum DSM 525 = ATCC 6013]KRU13402.1 Acetylornithine/succinyldiaminopimelate aminotransferase [Clostridium pasteurianum DSM 525 = ATCC 6013]